MLTKLAFRNVKRNIRTYFIYFATLALVYSLFYSFNAVIGSPLLNDISETKRILTNFMEEFMGIFSVVASLAFIFLVLYTTQFILKRRSNELGLYASLGMKNKKISNVLFLENLLVNALALFVGVIIGVVISIFLQGLLINIFSLDGSIDYFYLNGKSIKITLVCFVMIVVISYIFNKIKIKNTNIISLLKVDETKDVEVSIVRIKQIVFMIIFLVLLSVSAYLIYSLKDMSELKHSVYAILITAIIGVIGFFYEIGNFIFVLINRIPNLYYKGMNTVFIRKLSSETSKNSITIAVISIFLSLSFTSILIGGSSYISMNREIIKASPYNLSLFSMNPLQENQFIDELEEWGIDTKSTFSSFHEFYVHSSEVKYENLGIMEKKLWKVDKGLVNIDVPVISLSDYNKNMKMQGKDPLKLKENQYIINCNYKGTIAMIEDFLKEQKSIKINNLLLEPALEKPTKNTWMMTSVGNNDRGTLIVSDYIADKLKKDYSYLNAVYFDGVPERKLTKELNDFIMKETWQDESGLHFDYQYQTRDRLKDMFTGFMGALVFITLFVGIIFTLISLCILSLHSVTNSMSFKRDSIIIHSLGSRYREINKLMFKETLFYFLVPCIIAVPASILIGQKAIEFFEKFLNFHIEINIFVLLIQVVLFIIYIILSYNVSKWIILETKEQ